MPSNITPPSDSSPDSTTTGSNAPIQKSFSCVLCAQRKVKCDKAPGGCSNCTKARVQCIYKAPPPPRRRKKGVREIDAHARLRLYEDKLRSLGVDPQTLENEELLKAPARKDTIEPSERYATLQKATEVRDGKPASDPGVLVAGDGKSRYLENGLWTSLRREFRDSKELLEESSEDDEEATVYPLSPESLPSDGSGLLFGTPKPSISLRPLHPQPVQIFKLWQAYLDNDNPLLKLFHTPTVQQTVLNASSNLDDVPRNVEALMFGIYCVSLSSLSAGECDAIMGEPAAVVAQRFRTGAQHALANASFLKTSDLMVLQAYVLFLMSLQNYDPRIMWILTGMAGRIGQRLGLHRDPESLGLPPFESEMRRRLWWQIMFSDGFAEKLAGTGGNIFTGDCRYPSNLNDSDLFQGMKELPKEHEGATEMMHFLIRCHAGEFLKRSANPRSNFDGAWNKLTHTEISLAAKEEAIAELESILQRKFIQYCDPSVPWHSMCTYVAKAIIFMMKFMAHNKEPFGPEAAAKMPQSEKDMLFDISKEVTTYCNYAYTVKELQGFMWHVNLHFQWKSFIYMVSALRWRTQAPEADEAWAEVQKVYEFHPNFAKEVSRRALPVAVGNLTLTAWDAFVAARGVPEGGEPYFIQVLRARHAKRRPATSSSANVFPPQMRDSASSQLLDLTPASNDIDSSLPEAHLDRAAGDPLESFQWYNNFASSLDEDTVPDLPTLDVEQMNWSAWNDLLVDYQMNGDDTYVRNNGSQFGWATQ